MDSNSHEIKIRIRYGETDRMGYAHHANYPLYFEEARMEFLRRMDINYKELEDSGIILPIISINTKHVHPVFYDDIITITTRLKELPLTRFKFLYEVINQDNIIVAKAETELAFVNTVSGKPIKVPITILDSLKKNLSIH